MILSNILTNEDYSKRVVAFLQPEFFQELIERTIFECSREYVVKYNKVPPKEVIAIGVSNSSVLSTKETETAIEYISAIGTKEHSSVDQGWLLKETETFGKTRAFCLAIQEAAGKVSDRAKWNQLGETPKKVQDALALSLDTTIAHNFVEDWKERYDSYHEKTKRIPFDIDILNDITQGGLEPESLTILLGGTGAGKSHVLCHFAAANLMMGFNVLYITLEMSAYQTAKRIDANLLDVSIHELDKVSEEDYSSKIERLKSKLAFKAKPGALYIQKYPTSAASVVHFRALIEDLKIKKGFVPDVIYIDYLNICASTRIRPDGANMYSYVKFITEEVRGLCDEYKIPIITATQTTRKGWGATDLEMSDVSESAGVAHTVDYMWGLIVTEDLEQMGQMLFKQLKNRYASKIKMKKFVVGMDRDKMRLFNATKDEQEAYSESIAEKKESKNKKEEEDVPAFDKTKFGDKMKKRNDFSKFNFGGDNDDG